MSTRIVTTLLAALALAACGGSASSDRAAEPSSSPDTPVSHEAPPVADERQTDEGPPIVRQSEMWSGRSAPDPSFVTCSADADCATVEIGCCDHCNGGALAAVRAERVAEVRAAQTASCGETVACTERACANGTALCADGECAYVAAWRGGPPAP